MIDRLPGSRLWVSAVSLLIMSTSVPVWANEPGAASSADRAGSVTYDVLVLRTTGVVKTAVGAVFLIPAFPLSYGSGARDEVVSRLVVDPARDTFARPIGEL